MHAVQSSSDLFVQRSQYAASSDSALEPLIQVLSPLLADELVGQDRRLNTSATLSHGEMETRISSFQTFVTSVPLKAPKVLPPIPPVSALVLRTIEPRRSSSIYTQDTRFGESEKDLYDDPVIPMRPPSISASRPGLANSGIGAPLMSICPETNPISRILEPREYQPLLPSPSPSLGPSSKRNSYIEAPQMQYNRSNKLMDKFWTTLTHSPRLTPRPVSPEYSSSLLDIYSLTENTSTFQPRACSVSPPSSRSSRPSNPAAVHKPNSLVDMVTAKGAGFSSCRESKHREFPRYSGHNDHPSRDNAHAALLMMASIKPSGDDEWEDEEDSGEEEFDVLSSDYHNSLANQYRELAAPLRGQWESSDEEEKVRDIRLVPAPLFWKLRQRELYPNRVEHFLGNLNSDTRSQLPEPRSNKKDKKSKRGSGSRAPAPLKMTLASQFENSSGKNLRAEDTRSSGIPRSLFHIKRRVSIKGKYPNRMPSQHSGRLQTQHQLRMGARDAPLPLHLPSIVFRPQIIKTSRSPTMKYASATTGTLSPKSVKTPTQRGFSERNETRRDSAAIIDEMLADRSPKHTPPEFKPSLELKDYLQRQELLEDTDKSNHAPFKNDTSALYEPHVSSTTFPRDITCRPMHVPKSHPSLRSDIKVPVPPATMSSTPRKASRAIYTVVSKARCSIGHPRTAAASTSAKSRESAVTFDTIGLPYIEGEALNARREGVSQQKNIIRASSTSSKLRPKIIEKALELKRERERQKQRRALKASIKFVGQVDPNNVVVKRGRRETFGAGWI